MFGDIWGVVPTLFFVFFGKQNKLSCVQTLTHGGQNLKVLYNNFLVSNPITKHIPTQKSHPWQSNPIFVFSKQKYKRNPDPKIEKLSPVWGLRHHILLTTNSQPTPKNNDYEPTKDPICYNKSVPFGLFCFKKNSKDPNHPLPQKHFLTNFLAEILCQKDGRRSPRVLQPKVQSLQWIHAQDL